MIKCKNSSSHLPLTFAISQRMILKYFLLYDYFLKKPRCVDAVFCLLGVCHDFLYGAEKTSILNALFNVPQTMLLRKMVNMTK